MHSEVYCARGWHGRGTNGSAGGSTAAVRSVRRSRRGHAYSRALAISFSRRVSEPVNSFAKCACDAERSSSDSRSRGTRDTDPGMTTRTSLVLVERRTPPAKRRRLFGGATRLDGEPRPVVRRRDGGVLLPIIFVIGVSGFPSPVVAQTVLTWSEVRARFQATKSDFARGPNRDRGIEGQ